MNENAKKVCEVKKESSSENENTQQIDPNEIENLRTNIKSLTNSSNFSKAMQQMLGSLMTSRNSSKITRDEFRQPNILCVNIQISGGDKTSKKHRMFDLSPEIYKTLSSTSYTGKTMQDENDILMMNINLNDLGYTSIGDKTSKRKTFFKILFLI